MLPTIAERFWSYVDTGRGVDSCWLWTGRCYASGYGQFYVDRVSKQRYAHRIAWELANGPIPTGRLVCHTCDVRTCVNPAHMWLGSIADNIKDMWSKRRGVPGRGERHRSAKLTDDDIRFIREHASYGPHGRKQPEAGKMATTELARRFGVSACTIRGIKSGRYWRNVAA